MNIARRPRAESAKGSASSFLGQAIVEFALVLPVLMFMLLGFAEVAFLVGTRASYQNAADVLAQVAAIRMADSPGDSWRASWEQVNRDELARVRCDNTAIDLLDGDHEPGDRIRVRVSCTYQPHVANVFDGLGVVVESEAVVPVRIELPSPSPS